MKKLLYILLGLTVLAAGCSRQEDRRLFRWTGLSPRAEALAYRLDSMYTDFEEEAKLRPILEELLATDSVAGTHPELRPMWEGKFYDRLQFNTTNPYFSEALALCDSSKHPYEYMRIKTDMLKLIADPELQYRQALQMLDYWTQQKDSVMMSLMYNRLGYYVIPLENPELTMKYNQKGREMLEALGFNRAVRFWEVNNIPCYFHTLDSVEFMKKLDAMGENTEYMQDSLYRVNYLISRAGFAKDREASRELCEMVSRPNNISRNIRASLLAITAFNVIDENPDSAFRLIRRAIAVIGNSNWRHIRAYLYLDYSKMLAARGKSDSAYYYLAISNEYIDSVRTMDMCAKIEALKASYELENASKISELEQSRRVLKYNIAGISMLVVVLVVILFLVRKNARTTIKAQQSEVDLERTRLLLAKSMQSREEKTRVIMALTGQLDKLTEQEDNLPGLKTHRLLRATSERTDQEIDNMQEMVENVSSRLVANLRNLHPRLTESQLQIAVLSACGMSSKEIASMLNILQSSVNTSRYRLRKTLGLQPEVSLEEYLKALA